MASCQTTRWVSTAPYVKLIVTPKNETNSSITYDWALQYISDTAARTNGVSRAYSVTLAGSTVKSGTYNINGKSGTITIASGSKTVNKTTAQQTISFGVSFDFSLTWSGSYKGTLTASGTVTLAAKPKYTVAYNAAGGSGAPASQTKWYGTALTLSTTKPTRTGYTFQGWATSSGGSVAYASGAKYTTNAAVTLYAVWKIITYTITYNANGGSNAPPNQTKKYGTDLTLSTTKPTRTDYNFKGWGTSASATTVSYASGAKYTANEAATLYAIWEVAYIEPRITNLSVSRCDANKNLIDDGTYALIKFNWVCDKTVSSIKVEWEDISGTTDSKPITASGTSGVVDDKVGGSLDPEKTYIIRIIVTDSGGSTTIPTTLNGTKFIIDFCVDPTTGEVGASFGKPAETAGLLDIALQTRHAGGLLPVILEPNTDLDDVKTPNTYVGANTTTYEYVNCPLTSGTFTLLVESGGDSGQVRQRLTRCHKTEPRVWERWYHVSGSAMSWGDWIEITQHEAVLYNKSGGSAGTITLSETSANFKYLDIYFTDNNNGDFGYLKYYVPSGVPLGLHLIEPSSAGITYIRRTKYTVSGTTITPNLTTAGYWQYNGNTNTHTPSNGTNYIKILRVVGHR